jgi:hypothetical protein
MIRRLMVAIAAGFGALGIVVAAVAGSSDAGMPGSGSIMRPAFHAFYDDHVVVYLATDVSDKAEAQMMHTNFAPKLKSAMKSADEMYVFQGKISPGQLPVFTSEPGDASYSPLWHEMYVSWKPGSTPMVVKSDTDIEKLVKSGQLMEKASTIVLNCPIVKPIKSELGGS